MYSKPVSTYKLDTFSDVPLSRQPSKHHFIANKFQIKDTEFLCTNRIKSVPKTCFQTANKLYSNSILSLYSKQDSISTPLSYSQALYNSPLIDDYCLRNSSVCESYRLYPKCTEPFYPKNKITFTQQQSLNSFTNYKDNKKLSHESLILLHDFCDNKSFKSKEDYITSRTAQIRSSRKNLKYNIWEESIPIYKPFLSQSNYFFDFETPDIRIPRYQFLLELRALINLQLGFCRVNKLTIDNHIDDKLYSKHNSEQLIEGIVSGYLCGKKSCKSHFPTKYIFVSSIGYAALECIRTEWKYVNLKGHFITKIPAISHFFGTLTRLDLSFNLLNTIPGVIYSLIHLTDLNLRNNPICSISESICELKQLKCLSLSFCKLYKLPYTLYDLENLESLDIAYNNIFRISNRIENLSQLILFNIEGNKIPGLPNGIYNLKKLKYLKLANNYMISLIWEDFLNKEPEELQDLCLNIYYTFKEKIHQHQNCSQISYWLSNVICLRQKLCDNCGREFFGYGYEIIRLAKQPFIRYNSLPILISLCNKNCR